MHVDAWTPVCACTCVRAYGEGTLYSGEFRAFLGKNIETVRCFEAQMGSDINTLFCKDT